MKFHQTMFMDLTNDPLLWPWWYRPERCKWHHVGMIHTFMQYHHIHVMLSIYSS